MKNNKITTKKEIDLMILNGAIFLPLHEYKQKLNSFGFKLVISDKYLNTLNYNRAWLQVDAEANDNENKSFANVTGSFYINEKQKNTNLYNQFKEFRSTYFSLLPSGHIVNF